MPIVKILGSRLRLVISDSDVNQKSQVIVFAHGGETTGATFSNANGPMVRFYCPEGDTLYSGPKDIFRDFKIWSDRAVKAHPEWTIMGGNVPDYYLFKSDGYHFGGDRKGWNTDYPSQQPGYLSKGNIQKELLQTLKEYDIVLVRARGTQFNRKNIKLSEVVEKLKNNGYAHGTVHCYHCRGKSLGTNKFDFEQKLTPKIPWNNLKAFESIDLLALVESFGDDISFGEKKQTI